MNSHKIAVTFKALGDENRIKILRMLRGGEKCACKLLEALDISQSTLSHHMKILCDAGIVNGRREGKWMHYSINTAEAENIRSLLTSLTTTEKPPCGCNK